MASVHRARRPVPDLRKPRVVSLRSDEDSSSMLSTGKADDQNEGQSYSPTSPCNKSSFSSTPRGQSHVDDLIHFSPREPANAPLSARTPARKGTLSVQATKATSGEKKQSEMREKGAAPPNFREAFSLDSMNDHVGQTQDAFQHSLEGNPAKDCPGDSVTGDKSSTRRRQHTVVSVSSPKNEHAKKQSMFSDRVSVVSDVSSMFCVTDTPSGSQGSKDQVRRIPPPDPGLTLSKHRKKKNVDDLSRDLEGLDVSQPTHSVANSKAGLIQSMFDAQCPVDAHIKAAQKRFVSEDHYDDDCGTTIEGLPDALLSDFPVSTFPYHLSVSDVINLVLEQETRWYTTRMTPHVREFLFESHDCREILLSLFWTIIVQEQLNRTRAQAVKTQLNLRKYLREKRLEDQKGPMIGAPYSGDSTPGSSSVSHQGDARSSRASSSFSEAGGYDNDGAEPKIRRLSRKGSGKRSYTARERLIADSTTSLTELQAEIDAKVVLLERMFHLLAVSFGNGFRGIKAPTPQLEVIKRDEIMTLLPALSSHVIYYALCDLFPDDVSANVFNKAFRRRVLRQTHYWMCGVQLQVIPTGNWPQPPKGKYGSKTRQQQSADYRANQLIKERTTGGVTLPSISKKLTVSPLNSNSKSVGSGMVHFLPSALGKREKVNNPGEKMNNEDETPGMSTESTFGDGVSFQTSVIVHPEISKATSSPNTTTSRTNPVVGFLAGGNGRRESEVSLLSSDSGGGTTEKSRDHRKRVAGSFFGTAGKLKGAANRSSFSRKKSKIMSKGSRINLMKELKESVGVDSAIEMDALEVETERSHIAEKRRKVIQKAIEKREKQTAMMKHRKKNSSSADSPPSSELNRSGSATSDRSLTSAFSNSDTRKLRPGSKRLSRKQSHSSLISNAGHMSSTEFAEALEKELGLTRHKKRKEIVPDLQTATSAWYEGGKKRGYLSQQRLMEYGVQEKKTAAQLRSRREKDRAAKMESMKKMRKSVVSVGDITHLNKDEKKRDSLLESTFLTEGHRALLVADAHLRQPEVPLDVPEEEEMLKSVHRSNSKKRNGSGDDESSADDEEARRRPLNAAPAPKKLVLETHSPLMDYYMKFKLKMNSTAVEDRNRGTRAMNLTALSAIDRSSTHMRFGVLAKRTEKHAQKMIADTYVEEAQARRRALTHELEEKHFAHRMQLKSERATNLISYVASPRNPEKVDEANAAESLMHEAIMEKGKQLEDIMNAHRVAIAACRRIMFTVNTKRRTELDGLYMKCCVRLRALERSAPKEMSNQRESELPPQSVLQQLTDVVSRIHERVGQEGEDTDDSTNAKPPVPSPPRGVPSEKVHHQSDNRHPPQDHDATKLFFSDREARKAEQREKDVRATLLRDMDQVLTDGKVDGISEQLDHDIVMMDADGLRFVPSLRQKQKQDKKNKIKKVLSHAKTMGSTYVEEEELESDTDTPRSTVAQTESSRPALLGVPRVSDSHQLPVFEEPPSNDISGHATIARLLERQKEIETRKRADQDLLTSLGIVSGAFGGAVDGQDTSFEGSGRVQVLASSVGRCPTERQRSLYASTKSASPRKRSASFVSGTATDTDEGVLSPLGAINRSSLDVTSVSSRKNSSLSTCDDEDMKYARSRHAELLSEDAQERRKKLTSKLAASSTVSSDPRHSPTNHSLQGKMIDTSTTDSPRKNLCVVEDSTRSVFNEEEELKREEKIRNEAEERRQRRHRLTKQNSTAWNVLRTGVMLSFGTKSNDNTKGDKAAKDENEGEQLGLGTATGSGVLLTEASAWGSHGSQKNLLDDDESFATNIVDMPAAVAPMTKPPLVKKETNSRVADIGVSHTPDDVTAVQPASPTAPTTTHIHQVQETALSEVFRDIVVPHPPPSRGSVGSNSSHPGTPNVRRRLPVEKSPNR